MEAVHSSRAAFIFSPTSSPVHTAACSLIMAGAGRMPLSERLLLPNSFTQLVCEPSLAVISQGWGSFSWSRSKTSRIFGSITSSSGVVGRELSGKFAVEK